jgi:hypothetical protein
VVDSFIESTTKKERKEKKKMRERERGMKEEKQGAYRALSSET